MTLFPFLLFLTMLIAPTPMTSATPDTLTFTLDPESEVFYTADIRIALLATSTVTGRNREIKGEVLWIRTGDRPIVQANFTITAAAFDSGNRMRDRDVRNILDADSFPEITFELQSVIGLDALDLDALDGDYLANGYLTVRGTEKEINVPVQMNYSDGTLVVTGSTAAKYTDFGITPPRVAGFVGRAPDELRLHARIIAKRKDT